MSKWSTMKPVIVGKNQKPVGIVPAIILNNPKYAYNVGAIIRAASCFGVKQVIYTGDRIALDIEANGRIPREERMKGYKEVDLIQFDYPLDLFPQGTVPVAVEVRDKSENLHTFEHPENAVYIFGPEDGSVEKGLLVKSHRFVRIPTLHCTNLSAAVYILLYDRWLKKALRGEVEIPDIGAVEKRGFINDMERP